MSNPMDKLARLEALEKAASPRPWYAVGYGTEPMMAWTIADDVTADTEARLLGTRRGSRQNAELAAASRTAVPVLAAFLRWALDKHRECRTRPCSEDPYNDATVHRPHCAGCLESGWPCPTRQAAERALEEL